MASEKWRLIGFGFNGFGQLNVSRETSSGSTSSDITVDTPRVLMELPAAPSSLSVSSSWDSMYVCVSTDDSARSLCTGRWAGGVGEAEKLLKEGESIAEVVETPRGQLILRTREGRVLVVPSVTGDVWEVREGGENSLKQVAKMRCLNDGQIYSLLKTGAVNEYVFDSLRNLKLNRELSLGVRRVSDIACGADHCILLTSSGDLLSLGLGTRGQLGHGDLSPRTEPTLVELLAGVPVHSIACGLWHNLVLVLNGDLYSWGWNRDGQLGLRQTESTTVALPTVVDTLPETSTEIVSVSCGSRHSAAVSKAGDMFCWGWGGYGQVGSTSQYSITGPGVHSVYCCHWSTLYLQH